MLSIRRAFNTPWIFVRHGHLHVVDLTLINIASCDISRLKVQDSVDLGRSIRRWLT